MKNPQTTCSGHTYFLFYHLGCQIDKNYKNINTKKKKCMTSKFFIYLLGELECKQRLLPSTEALTIKLLNKLTR